MTEEEIAERFAAELQKAMDKANKPKSKKKTAPKAVKPTKILGGEIKAIEDKYADNPTLMNEKLKAYLRNRK